MTPAILIKCKADVASRKLCSNCAHWTLGPDATTGPRGGFCGLTDAAKRANETCANWKSAYDAPTP